MKFSQRRQLRSFRYVEPIQTNRENKNISRVQHFSDETIIWVGSDDTDIESDFWGYVDSRKGVFCFGSFIDFYAAAELQWEAEIQQGSTQAVVQRLDNTRRPQYAFEDSGLLPLKAASRFL
ncbi:hypothetical protein GQ457_02G031550 [Hibiscus cannabinus]